MKIIGLNSRVNFSFDEGQVLVTDVTKQNKFTQKFSSEFDYVSLKCISLNFLI